MASSTPRHGKPSNIRDFVRKTLGSQLSRKALETVALELERRAIRVTQIPIVDYIPPVDTHLRFAMPGTVTIYCCRQGDPLMAKLRRLPKASARYHDKLAAELQARNKPRKPKTLDAAAKFVTSQPVFADVRAGGHTVARNLVVPKGADHCTTIMPYNGGLLPRNCFTLAEHLTDGADTGLAALALRYRPRLTPAERAALRALPASQRELNVGVAGITYALTGVAVAAVVTLVACVCFCGFTPLVERRLTDEQIAELGPQATARELLRLRRLALGM